MTDSVAATWALRTDATLDEVNVHLASLEAAGLLGMAEEAGVTTAYFSRRSDDLPLSGTWEQVAERDWNAAWKAGFDPVVVGEVSVVAPWHPPQPATAITLVVEPAQAFGTGHHETTTACLAALQALDLTNCSVFDVGTGTGVLALAAKALGAQRVVAVDIDPLAVQAATVNSALNGLAIEVIAGSTEAAGGDQFDVVIANIDTATVTELAVPLVEAVRPGGAFIGSGVSNERSAEAVAALQAAGLAVTATHGVEWALLTGGDLRSSSRRR